MHQVFLNVYDVTNTQSENTNNTIVKINSVTRDIGLGGIFHGAIQIDQYEWSFGYCEHGTGVYACRARSNPMYTFRESIDLGPTPKSKQQIHDIMNRLKHEWPGVSYDLFARNCCTFCDVLARQLETKPVPGWLNRFAAGADATLTFANEVSTVARRVSQNVTTTAGSVASWVKGTVSSFLAKPEGSANRGDCNSEVESTSSVASSLLVGNQAMSSLAALFQRVPYLGSTGTPAAENSQSSLPAELSGPVTSESSELAGSEENPSQYFGFLTRQPAPSPSSNTVGTIASSTAPSNLAVETADFLQVDTCSAPSAQDCTRSDDQNLTGDSRVPGDNPQKTLSVDDLLS